MFKLYRLALLALSVALVPLSVAAVEAFQCAPENEGVRGVSCAAAAQTAVEVASALVLLLVTLGVPLGAVSAQFPVRSGIGHDID